MVGRDGSCDRVACARPPSQNPPGGFPATGSPGCARWRAVRLCLLRDLVQLCEHSFPTSECAGNVSLDQPLNLPRCFPMFAAFPRSEYYQRVRLPPSLLSPSGWSIRLTYSARYRTKTAVDLPGSMVLPFPPVPCSQTPPESPAPLPFAGAYWCLPSFRPCRPPVVRVTRLNRFTCVTARTSLCLRLAHVVTFMSPRLDSRWGGSFPLPGRESHPLEAPGLAWRTEKPRTPEGKKKIPVESAAFWSTACSVSLCKSPS
jgi:hypothetical protein